MRLRLLKYSIRIREENRRKRPAEKHLRPIVPLVLYQGRRGWTPAAQVAYLDSAGRLLRDGVETLQQAGLS